MKDKGANSVYVDPDVHVKELRQAAFVSSGDHSWVTIHIHGDSGEFPPLPKHMGLAESGKAAPQRAHHSENMGLSPELIGERRVDHSQ